MITIEDGKRVRQLMIEQLGLIPQFLDARYAVEAGCIIVDTRFTIMQPMRRFKVNMRTFDVEEIDA